MSHSVTSTPTDDADQVLPPPPPPPPKKPEDDPPMEPNPYMGGGTAPT